MRRWLLLLLVISFPGFGEMSISRELVAPAQVVPGQPLRIAITYWTDSWFNPPPSWPEIVVENGALLTTPLPNQLLTRQQGGKSWSGIRLEKLVAAWDQGMLRFPPLEVTLSSAGQPPRTVQLPAIEQAVAWPADVRQPDRFLPASKVTMTQQIDLYRAGEGDSLHAGDAIERRVTVKAEGAVPTQIPQLLYAIQGTPTQRLTPSSELLETGRGDFLGGRREERLRYLPTAQGTVTLPALTLRWWDTERQAWQSAELPGADYQVAAPRAAGREALLRASTLSHPWWSLLLASVLVILVCVGYLARHSLWRAWRFAREAIKRFWDPVPLPNLIPTTKEK
ncbi:MAG: oxygen tolerance domain protein [Aeromonas molluscorum]